MHRLPRLRPHQLKIRPRTPLINLLRLLIQPQFRLRIIKDRSNQVRTTLVNRTRQQLPFKVLRETQIQVMAEALQGHPTTNRQIRKILLHQFHRLQHRSLSLYRKPPSILAASHPGVLEALLIVLLEQTQPQELHQMVVVKGATEEATRGAILQTILQTTLETTLETTQQTTLETTPQTTQ